MTRKTASYILIFITLIMIIGFAIYDNYVTEETFDNAAAAAIMDAKVNSQYVHDQTNDVRQVTFDVDVPLNRYYVSSVSTSPPPKPMSK